MRIGIALGSNVGDRLANLCAARDAIRESHEGSESDFVQSSVYETEPVDCAPGTAAFLNAVIEIESAETPLVLLKKAQAIERSLGRPAMRATNAPRTIDLDLLYAGELKLDTPDLQLPHPRMTVRRFVLEPLSEIRPSMKTSGESLTINELLQEFRKSTDDLKLFRRDW